MGLATQGQPGYGRTANLIGTFNGNSLFLSCLLSEADSLVQKVLTPLGLRWELCISLGLPIDSLENTRFRSEQLSSSSGQRSVLAP
jgi:hypothetical protein